MPNGMLPCGGPGAPECDEPDVPIDVDPPVDDGSGDIGDPGTQPPGEGGGDVNPPGEGEDPPTEEDPDPEPPGEGGGGDDGGGPVDEEGLSCGVEPPLTGVVVSTEPTQVALGEPFTKRFGTGIKATDSSTITINAPVVVGMNKRGIESRRESIVKVNGGICRGGEYGIIASISSTAYAARFLNERNGGVHAEHSGTIIFGRDSLAKNVRQMTCADASFLYLIGTTSQTTKFTSDDTKAYKLLSLRHMRLEGASHAETNSTGPTATIFRGDFEANEGSANYTVDESSSFESEPIVTD